MLQNSSTNVVEWDTYMSMPKDVPNVPRDVDLAIDAYVLAWNLINKQVNEEGVGPSQEDYRTSELAYNALNTACRESGYKLYVARNIAEERLKNFGHEGRYS